MNTITLTDEINAISIELTDVEGLQDLTETIDLSEDKTLTFSVTGEISVIGNSGYQFIKDYFFGCDSLCNNKSLDAQLYISCCDTLQDFVIERSTVKYDINNCKIQFEMLTSSTIEQGKDFLDSRYWWKDYLADNFYSDFINYKGGENGLLSYPSFLFVDILNYQLGKAGITLQSNLLATEPYNNLCFTFNNSAPILQGSFTNTKSNTRTTLDLIKDVATLLNAEFIFTTDANNNNTLIFEHKSYFLDSDNYTLISLEDFYTPNSIELQYVENEDDNCKSIRYAYEFAGITDYVIETQTIYSTLVEFTENNDPLAESCEKIMPFHAPLLDETTGKFSGLTSNEFKSERDIIITIWDGNGNKGDENGTNYPIFSSPTNQWNYPLYFDKDAPNGLYQKFHYLDDPSISSCSMELSDGSIELKPIDITFCDFKQIIDNNGLFILFTITDSEGCKYYLKPNTVNLNYGTNTITLENIKFN
jgi:hypothetical protein